MTTQTAFRLAAHPDVTDEQWDALASHLEKAGYCPSCAREGGKIRLGPLEPADHFNYAGRYCPQCEEFYRTPGQDSYLFDTCDLDVVSDADPGL